jgi:hypothetical protein
LISPDPQQSPLSQQKLFAQWPLAQSRFFRQTLPFGASSTQVLLSQCALASHSASLLHDAGQTGALWSAVPLQ